VDVLERGEREGGEVRGGLRQRVKGGRLKGMRFW
jgi:hypothetical protein